jgi:hypothetical protein
MDIVYTADSIHITSYLLRLSPKGSEGVSKKSSHPSVISLLKNLKSYLAMQVVLRYFLG